MDASNPVSCESSAGSSVDVNIFVPLDLSVANILLSISDKVAYLFLQNIHVDKNHPV